MDNIGYATISRQAGLWQEMQIIANNIANAQTTGFRREGLTFAEHIDRLGRADASLSMATAEVRRIDDAAGALRETGSPLDLAIEGDGFFEIETPEGIRLTRAGSFSTNEEGVMVTPDGGRLLDIGGAPVFVPPDARDFAIARDGTVQANGMALSRIGLVIPADPTDLQRAGAGLYTTVNGTVPVEAPALRQGFVEESNVNPIEEISRMIEVQRSYELGQKFLEQEHERIRSVISTLGQ